MIEERTPMDDVAEIGQPAGLWRGNMVAVAAAVAAGLALRTWWILHYGQTTNDTRVYGEFARNLLEHHVYGWTHIVKGVLMTPQPTLIRLPGYPLFLALCFALFGVENYTGVMAAQAAMDLWTCLLLGGVASRMFGRRAGVAAVWMAALCPFMANYVAAPLTETLTLWSMALAFYGVVRWRQDIAAKTPLNGWMYVVGFALAYAILLRPEQGLLAAAVVPAMLWMGGRPALRGVVVVSVLTLLPLAPWTVRNWRVFHVFEPLAPKFATDPGDRINYGFQRWFRTWGIEFMSTETVYWNYDGAAISIADLPDRAFDSNAQYAETEAVLATYNLTDSGSYALDARFAKIAAERVHADPVRYYLALPVARVLDMMFRPRTEMLPVPLEWWKFNERRGADVFALAYAGLNLAFFVVAGIGFRRRESWRGQEGLVWMMVGTLALRTAVLLTLDNSEDRYTLEFFPVLVVLGSVVVGKATSRAAS